MLFTVGISIKHTCDLTRFIMFNLKCLRINPDLQIPGCFADWNFIVTSRPFSAPLTSLEAKPSLLASNKIVVVLGINCHPSGMDIFVTKFFGTRFKNLEVVVSRKAFSTTRPCYPKFVLSFGIIGIHNLGINRPV